MSALNKKAESPVSYEGNPQSRKTHAQNLYEIIVMTLYGKDSFYESVDHRVERLKNAIEHVVSDHNLDFVANAIIHARTHMNIRSMPIVATVLFIETLRKQGLVYPNSRQMVTDVIQRADQITDMYAVALAVFGDKKSVPMSIKRGVADAFNKFNEYQFAKYNRNGVVKMRDVLRIVHPKPTSEDNGQIFQKIVEDTLSVPYTWETVLTTNGQKPVSERASDKELWTELLKSNALGYMALLRNLRNIHEAGVDNVVLMEHVYARLSDPEQVARSKQLPFRFVNALYSVSKFNNAKLNQALSRALDASVANVPHIGDNIWLIIDCSGSMMGSSEENNSPFKIAAVLGAALAKANSNVSNFTITAFSNDAYDVNFNPDDSVMGITQTILGYNKGYLTNLQAALDRKDTLGYEPDTVIVLSDMQVKRLNNRSAVDIFAPDTIKIAIDLEAYNTTPIGEVNGWMQLSGWSERLFDFIPAMRESGSSVVEQLSVPYTGINN